jgi:hypothetical protein
VKSSRKKFTPEQRKGWTSKKIAVGMRQFIQKLLQVHFLKAVAGQEWAMYFFVLRRREMKHEASIEADHRPG